MSDIWYISLYNAAMSEVVESELIRRYKPKYNKAKMSDWDGLPFVEPKWTLYRVGSDKVDNLVRDLKAERAKNDVLERTLDALERERDELKKIAIQNVSIESQMRALCLGCNLRKIHDCHSEVKDASGVLFKDIVDKYKDGSSPISYLSDVYDAFGNLVCSKHIYTDAHDCLCFEFCQSNMPDTHGTIFYSRDDDHKKYADVLRQWENRGGNTYFPAPPKISSIHLFNEN